MLAPIVALVLSSASVETGIASYYSEPQRIACGGGQFNPDGMTAAHKSLPCGTQVRVTNKRNGSSVIVTINDRGPFVPGRIIDVSKAAAVSLGMINSGTAPVTVEVVKAGTELKELKWKMMTSLPSHSRRMN